VREPENEAFTAFYTRGRRPTRGLGRRNSMRASARWLVGWTLANWLISIRVWRRIRHKRLSLVERMGSKMSS